MASPTVQGFTAFSGDRLIARGDLLAIALAAHTHREEALLVFEDATGRPIDLDLRGSAQDALARLSSDPQPAPKP